MFVFSLPRCMNFVAQRQISDSFLRVLFTLFLLSYPITIRKTDVKPVTAGYLALACHCIILIKTYRVVSMF